MLRYRVLLIDTAGAYRRPIQAYFNDMIQVNDWANKVLAIANKGAWVVVYEVLEKEVGTIRKPVPIQPPPNDEKPVQDLQQTETPAS